MDTTNPSNDTSIDDDAELLALERLLSTTDDVQRESTNDVAIPTKVPCLRDDSTFFDALNDGNTSKSNDQLSTLTVTKEMDSSDDEDIGNFLERKYSEYGSDLNQKLKQQRIVEKEKRVIAEVNSLMNSPNLLSTNDNDNHATRKPIKNIHNPIQRKSLVSTSFKQPIPNAAKNTTNSILPYVHTIFTDPIFGLRIINPLISSTLLVERMSGRKAVPFSGVTYHINHGDLSKDWVIGGVIVNKSPVRMTKKDQPYSIWRLSDLRGDIKMVSLFMFKGAHKELWKTAQGMCVAVLNPTIFENREKGDIATLSIDSEQKMMVLGQSKDFGMCKAKKRNGDACTSVVNLAECDVCVFHIKQEYGKMSKRSELQSSTSGRGLNELRNKVLGKSEVFYGGQSFSATVAKKSAKLTTKDNNRMSMLSEYAVSPFSSSINHKSQPKSGVKVIPYAQRDCLVSKVPCNFEISSKQRLKDLERLKALEAENNDENCTIDLPTTSKNAFTPTSSRTSSSATVATSQSATITSSPNISSISNLVPEKYKNHKITFSADSPKLSEENFSFEFNINTRKSSLAKTKAIELIKKRPIEKLNPNSVRGSNTGKRRAIDDLNEKFCEKRQKIEDQKKEEDRKSRIQRIIDATSSHTNLVDLREIEEREKIFNKLEKKESLEEKMLNTFKVPCKVVICKLCKYTSYSAAEHCKAKSHPLKIVDAMKRFFKCNDCGNRTTSVFKFPKVSCQNCQGSRWERTAMIREKTALNDNELLSVRGDEESILGSLTSKTNLNLLVPEE